MTTKTALAKCTSCITLKLETSTLAEVVNRQQGMQYTPCVTLQRSAATKCKLLMEEAACQTVTEFLLLHSRSTWTAQVTDEKVSSCSLSVMAQTVSADSGMADTLRRYSCGLARSFTRPYTYCFLKQTHL